MAYASLTDILDRIGETTLVELTDDNGQGVADETIVGRTISDADRLIDGYLSVRFRLPLNPVPDLVRAISADLAVYELYSRRDRMVELRSARRDRAIELLEKLAAGTIRFDGDEPASRETVKTSTAGKPRTFTLGPAGTLENL